MRTSAEVELVQRLRRRGLTPTEIGRVTAIPRSTVRDWCNGEIPDHASANCLSTHLCHIDETAYAYLLGMYLGDGCISVYPRGVEKLRITLDAKYQGIVEECAAAMLASAPGRRISLYARRDQRTVEVSSYWKHWTCLFPQHGVGAKHLRPIVLADWQHHIAEAHPRPFIRGLIHSDGTRIVATERKGNYTRRAPRYAFSNRSEDILQLFQWACRSVGVHSTRASFKQVAVYSKASVARLDEFVGPKT